MEVKNMVGVFMSSGAGALKTVYNESTRKALAEKLSFIADMNQFGDADFESRQDELNKVDFIFSTWGMPSLSSATIVKYLPNLKAVFYGAGSVQGFARGFLENGITVVSAWAANGTPVAEYTVAQIILANKGFFHRFRHGDQSTPTGSDKIYTSNHFYKGNFNADIGIIGAGMIGKMVIEMLKNYHLNVYAYDPFLSDDDAVNLEIKKESLEFIFSECDVISNHLANNAQTVGMLNKRLFSLMKPDVTFINTGRGAQVVEDDLIAALTEEPARIALLDVTFPEPPHEDSMLGKLSNVFYTPHIAGSIGYEVERMGEYMLDEFLAYIDNRPLKYAVSLKMLETMA
jgi:phosphoglycerate dehydrogenase-like enzyme